MAEYIEKEAALDSLLFEMCGTGYQSRAMSAVEKLPAADAAPVLHGRWVLLDECYNEGVYCSACHKKVYKTCYANQKIKSKFCPNCGARMDVTK